LLAIVWDLKNLRNYLYGVIGIEMKADHQSLSFTIWDKNPNVEMKRYPKNNIQTRNNNYNSTKTDVLSRIQINNFTNSDIDVSGQSNSDQDTQHSAKSRFENEIQETRKPVNQFKQQLLLTT